MFVHERTVIFFSRFKGGGGCGCATPLKLTQELSQKISYSSELWYGSCFYDVYSGTAKKRRRNRRYRRKPPSAAEIFFVISRWIRHFWNIWKNYPNIFHLTLGIFQISKKSWAQIIQKCLIQREMAKKISGWWRFFGWVPALVLMVSKSGTPPSPSLYREGVVCISLMSLSILDQCRVGQTQE